MNRNHFFIYALLCVVLALAAGVSNAQMVPAPGINTSSAEGSPAMGADPLTIYFASNRSGNSDIYKATRTSIGATWLTPVAIAELNTTSSEAECCVRTDGLEMIFSSNRAGGLGSGDLYLTTRTLTSSPWNPPVNLTNLNTSNNENGAALSPDGLELYWHAPYSTYPDDIWKATRPNLSSRFQGATPSRVVEISTTSNECTPSFSPDGLMLFFASNRPGGFGDFDIYYCTRTSIGAPWGTPENFTAANSSARDFQPLLSWDSSELYVESPRPGGAGGADIWVLVDPFPESVSPNIWNLME